jgi:membrane protein
LEGPIRLVRELLFDLVSCGILSESTTTEYKKTAYQPAQDINKLTIKYVVDALDCMGSDNMPLADTGEMKNLLSNLETFNSYMQKSPANIPLVEM